MKAPFVSSLVLLGLLPFASEAALIATEAFNYPDGSVADLSGGTGWAYERTDEAGAPAQSPSDWDNVFGNSQVVSSTLVTNNSGAKREFGGASEGAGFPSNEREGAFRGTGAMFFSASMNIANLLPAGQGQWCGVSSYDFGTERIFWGMPGQATETRFFGIEAPGFGSALSTIPIQSSVDYTILGMLDFDTNLLALWINPDGNDTVSTYDVSLAYTGGNWSSALRFASGTSVTWDDVKVGTDFSDVTVPEPSVPLLALSTLGSLVLLRRRA